MCHITKPNQTKPNQINVIHKTVITVLKRYNN